MSSWLRGSEEEGEGVDVRVERVDGTDAPDVLDVDKEGAGRGRNADDGAADDL